MKRTLVILSIVALIGSLSACASLGLMNTPNATAEQIKAARCSDAQLGLAIATVALAKPQTVEGKSYWDRYLEAVQLAVTTYCM